MWVWIMAIAKCCNIVTVPLVAKEFSVNVTPELRQRILTIVGIVVGLLVALIIGGWAFILGIGLLFGAVYRSTQNRGFLTLSGGFVGMAIGTLIEMAMNLSGGIPILAGIGIGLIGAYLVDRSTTSRPYLWVLIVGILIAAIALVTWFLPDGTTKTTVLNMLRTPALLTFLVGAVIECLQERNKKLQSAT
jgi:hypothetical protein